MNFPTAIALVVEYGYLAFVLGYIDVVSGAASALLCLSAQLGLRKSLTIPQTVCQIALRQVYFTVSDLILAFAGMYIHFSLRGAKLVAHPGPLEDVIKLVLVAMLGMVIVRATLSVAFPFLFRSR